MARTRARRHLWAAIALVALLLGYAAVEPNMASSASTVTSSTENSTAALPSYTNLFTKIEQAVEQTAMVAAAVDPVPAYAPPPATYTVQSGVDADGLVAVANRLTASYPELLALATRYPDLFWSCNKEQIPDPNVIRGGQVLVTSCDLTADQVTPISSWTPPAPPAPVVEPVATPVAEVASATSVETTPAPAEEVELTPAPAPAAAPQGSFTDYALSQLGDSGQFDCLEDLWGKESGWNPDAQNPSSSAYGIAQFLDSTWAGTGIAKTSDGYRQIDAGLIYIQNRYGSPCGAWSHSQSTGWY